ncbi:hypothetical protein [Klebsiella variicola]|uniref:hypothetical protein n=1 Tax=Klebsiella variicola TaxID=244366 RepID=UPI003D31BFFE
MTDITELTQSKSLRKKLNRRLNDAYGFQRTSGGKHTTISLSIDECKSIIAAMDERLALVEALEKAQLSIAELEREQEHLRPVGVMSEKAFHRLENSECRFIALWPRPGIFLPRKRPEDGVIVYALTVAAAGIKVEAE